MTFDTPLANGHLLNLQPRPHRGKGAMLGSDADDTQDDGPVELSTRSESNNFGANTSATSPQPKATPTRLPVLKDFTGKDHRERKNISTPVKQKGRDWSSEHESPKSLDQERERYWRKVRGRFDRDTLSPRIKEKQKANHHGAYRKIISLASSPRQEIAQKLKYSGSSSSEKSCTSETSLAAKANNSTPERQNNSKESTSSNQDCFSDGKGRMNSNHSASSGGSGSSSQKFKTDSTTDSSYNSNSSVSPISGPSIKEWEDKFVVNMPSEREPNPPTLNVRQITQYQNSIEKVQKEGVSMVDPDTLPSPRTLTPEHHLKPPDQNGKRLGMLDGQDSRPSSSNKDADSGLTYPNHPHYYCPDEVGKQRFSTIWEESSTSPKQKSPNANPDGSFLGCKEINGPHDRNPDEILYFSTPERPKVVNIPSSRTPRMPRELKLAPLRQTERAPGESLVQEEWEPISQNLKHAQCSKLSPKLLCREAQCQQLKTKKFTNPTAKEGPDSTGKRTGSSENLKSNPRADDVFIITPTITRTMVTMTDLRHDPPRNPGAREPTARSAGEIITDARTKLPINTKAGASPSGLRRVSQNSWERSNAHSAKASDPAPAMNIPAVRHRAEAKATTTDRSTAVGKPRGMRGFTRTLGIPRSSTETRIDTPPNKTSGSTDSSLSTRATNIPSRKSTQHSSEARRSSLTDRTIYSPSTHRSSSQPCGTMMQAKIVDVAELDGHQLNDHRENDFGNNPSSSNYNQLDNRIRPDITRIMSSETLHMIIDLIFLSGNQVQGFCQQIKANRGSKLVLLKLFLNGILGMLEHCLLVLRKGLAVISAYNTTGVWPKANDKDLAWLFTDLGQALVYLVVLGFVAMVIARAVGFVILIGSWVVWFARPFALAFRTVSRVLSL